MEELSVVILRFLSHFKIPTNEPELNRARYDAIKMQMPINYFLLTLASLGMCIAHLNLVSPFLLFPIPAILLCVSIAKLPAALQHKTIILTDKQIVQKLQMSVKIAPLLSFALFGWNVMLFEVGDPALRGLVVFYAAVAIIGGAMTLLSVPQASKAMLFTTMPTTFAFLILQFDLIYTLSALNLLMVAGVLYIAILSQDRGISDIVKHQKALLGQSRRLEQLNAETLRLANTDPLTKLPNRRSFFQTIEDTIEDYEDANEEFVLALLDLDGFKPVNDIFGHPAGDQLLASTAKRLSSKLGTDVVIGRLGGDEFGLLFLQPQDDATMLKISEDICTTLRQPFRLEEGTANIGGTIGLARFPHAGNKRSTMFDRADYALCYAKQNSKGAPVFFSQEHEVTIREALALEQRLTEANLEQELYVEFQPIVDTKANRVKGFEALARWYSPILGQVSPSEFITTAEQAGSIRVLTTILLKKALSEMKNWPEDVYMAFNLSAILLSSKSSMQRLIELVHEAGISPNQIVFEITESMIMKDFDRVIESLNYIREEGFALALDDFGTGYSSLSYVQKMPIDRLKIDRTFIKDMARNSADRNIVKTIADLCRNLKLDCVVEGVETERQLQLVTDLDLHFIQGYYFSKPLAPAAAKAFAHFMNEDQEYVPETKVHTPRW